MAANNHFSGTQGGEIISDRPIGHLLVNVTGNTVRLSFDDIVNFIELPIGFHSFPIGPANSISIAGLGTWEIVAVQA